MALALEAGGAGKGLLSGEQRSADAARRGAWCSSFTRGVVRREMLHKGLLVAQRPLQDAKLLILTPLVATDREELCIRCCDAVSFVGVLGRVLPCNDESYAFSTMLLF